MKKPLTIVLAILTLTFLISCGKHTENKHEHSSTEKTVEHKEISESLVSLDNGKLWSANTETTQGINNMKNLMKEFSDKESVSKYTSLKNNLEKEFSTILTECTMKGESHNQLHNYLVPMKEMFEGLTSSDLGTCKENYNTLNDHLKEYPKYFN